MTTDPIAAARALIAANSLSAGNVGHGHVFPRPDGVRARCGGPKMCKECAADLARKLDPWSALATLADALETEQAENQRLRDIALKAFTVVEWVAGEGFLLPDPHWDADDLLLEMAKVLEVEDSDSARAALHSTETNHDD